MAAITTTPLVSAEEYIARFVDGGEKPTCEYVNGVLFPKSMGTKRHSQVQANLTRLIGSRYDETLNPLPELTARLREGQFYVPDLAIEELAKPIQGRYPGPNDPVLLCVEIVSPPDRVGKLFGKCEEYHKWGVPYCWVIDPDRKIAWEYFPADLEPRKSKHRPRFRAIMRKRNFGGLGRGSRVRCAAKSRKSEEILRAGPIQLSLHDVFRRV